MSTLMNFISSLMPHIKKTSVQKDLEATIKELGEFSIPMSREMANQFVVVKFKSDFYDLFKAKVEDYVKFEKKSDNLWLNLTTALTLVQANAQELKSLVDDYMQEDMIADGLSARAAHMLRLAGAMSFVSAYTTEVCNYILLQEAVTLGDSDDSAPVQAKYIRDNIDKYARLLADVAIPAKDFKTLVSDIPEVFLNPKSRSTVAAMFSPKQLDPFKNMSGMSNWIGSPVYSIRMAWETWQAERFHAAKERKSMLELRLIHLQNRQHNETNPRIQKEIEGLEKRIRMYEQKIRKSEEAAGL